MCKLNYIFLLGILMLFGCDGRERSHKTNEEILKDSKLLDSFIENIQYIPDSYSEVENDTLLSNGFRVKIKTYTEMNDNVINEFTIDSINYKFHYRTYTGKLEFFYKNEAILELSINKSYFKENKDKEFWEKAILGGISIDENKIFKNKVYLNIFYCIPESEICKDYNLIVDKKGNTSLEELDPEPIH